MIDLIVSWFIPTAHAQLSTSTVETIVDNLITDGGTILSGQLPKLFGIGLALAFAVFLYFVIRGMLRRPR